MKETKTKNNIQLPKDLKFEDYCCYNCKYMNGSQASKIWCDYYRGYCDPCYCDHFIRK